MSSTILSKVSDCSTGEKLPRELLHGYQHKLVNFFKSTPKCAAWVDMGLGKTVSTLTAIGDMLADFEIGRVLIVAPLRVAHTTWPNEIEAWEHTSGLTYQVIKGSPKQRFGLLQGNEQIHIINRELLPWLVETLDCDWPYDTVVLDEASSFKSSKSKRWKALRLALPLIDRVIELTGTPASNGLLDLWAQTYLLDKGKRLGRTYSSYRDAHFNGDYMGWKFTLKPGHDEIIHNELADICLTLSANDYLDLPRRIDNIIEVELSAKARKQYDALERDCYLELLDEEITAFNAAALTNKLLQFSNGALYHNSEGDWQEIHTAKLDALESIIEEAAGEPVLVAYNFKSDVARILNKFKNATVLDKNPETVNAWNRGEIPILLAHPASAGHGLNLQKGGNVAVWFGLNWSLELYQQFNARLHRQGQTKPVFIHHIVTKDTLDSDVLTALDEKDATQTALLEAIKQKAEGVIYG